MICAVLTCGCNHHINYAGR